jgi:hypothetical protein
MFSRCSGGIVRSHFKHSVELADGNGEIADHLAGVEDLMLVRATYDAALKRSPKERIRLRQLRCGYGIRCLIVGPSNRTRAPR